MTEVKREQGEGRVALKLAPSMPEETDASAPPVAPVWVPPTAGEIAARAGVLPFDQRTKRYVDAPLASPAPESGLLGVFQRRYVLKLLVQREVAARYQGSVLGLMWSYINPLTQLFIYYVIMGKVVGLGSRVENFAVHVFCGLIIVHFFTETFGAGTRSIVRNKGLVQKMAVPREMFPVASMLVSLYHVIPEVVILTLTCLLVGWHPDAGSLVAGVLGLGIVMVLGLALALVFSAANVFFRDVGSVIAILTNFIRFSVPMIYPFSLVATRFGGHVHIYLLNPIANAVLLFNRAFWLGTTKNQALEAKTQLPPHLFARGGLALGVAFILLIFAQMIFRRLEGRIPERLS